MGDSSNSLRDRHVQVRLSQEEYAKLERDAKAAGLRHQGYLQALIAFTPAGVNPYAAHSEQHEMLEFLLRYDKTTAEWITGNLHMFVEAVRSRAGAKKRRRDG